MPSPIALFVYNRPEFTKLTVESLRINTLASASDLYIFSDGYKSEKDQNSVLAVRNYIKSVTGFKSINIIESPTNKGLAESLITGISSILTKHENVIVLEDDLLTSKYFLSFLNQGLEMYRDDDRVISIHAYMYPVKEDLPETFFIRGADCWGWATWKRGWSLFEKDCDILLEELRTKNLKSQFDFNNSYPYTRMLMDQKLGVIDSWAIRWYASAFLKNRLTLYPKKSLVKNIGMAAGTHADPLAKKLYNTEINDTDIKLARNEIDESAQARASIAKHFRRNKITLMDRVVRKLGQFIGAK